MISELPFLVCTDFSKNSFTALCAVKEFLHTIHSKIYILHVIQYPIEWDWSFSQVSIDFYNANLEIELIKNAKERMLNDLSEIGIDGDVLIRIGNVHQVINEVIDEKRIGLVFIGHKGKGQSPLALGGVATKIISTSKTPVFVFKSPLYKTRIAGLIDPNGPMGEIIRYSFELKEILNCSLEFVSLIADIRARFIGIGKVGFSTKLLRLSDKERAQLVHNTANKIRSELKSNSSAEIKVEISLEKKLAFHLTSILAGDHTNIVVIRRQNSSFLEKTLIGSETRRMLEIFDGNLLILPP